MALPPDTGGMTVVAVDLTKGLSLRLKLPWRIDRPPCAHCLLEPQNYNIFARLVRTLQMSCLHKAANANTLNPEPVKLVDFQRFCVPTFQLDDLDRKILVELATNGRLSNIDLASRLPLSHSAISRRITRLEQSGAIRSYGANIDPLALGLSIRAFVGVRRDPTAQVEQISTALRAIPEVAACWIVTGEHDFLLDLRAADMAGFSDALLNRVQKVPGVVSSMSVFVLSDVPSTRGP